MPPRLPPEAFDTYLTAGPSRSHACVAVQFGVAEEVVRRTAAREQWEARVAALQAWVASQGSAAPGGAGELVERHRKILHAIQAKSLEALRTIALRDGAAAIQALQLALRQERRLLQLLEDGKLDGLDDAARREYDDWSRGGG